MFVGLLIVSAVLITSIVAWNWRTKPTKQIKSIAVLPFNQIGEGERDETVEFGMADMLITRLSSLKQIIVRPTSAVFKYSGQKPDAVTVGRDLKVDAVLDGSIQRSGERVRVTMRLLNTDDGSSLWAQHFDTAFTDIFTLQDSISEQVVRALTFELSDQERALWSRRSTENTDAYRLYITGRHFFNKRGSVESLRKSIGYYEQAIAKDPKYARAYAGLADCYQLLAEYMAATPKEGFTKAREAATKALELDDQLAEAHTSLAYTLAFYDWDFVGAEREFKRALELDPNYPTAHQWYGEFLLAAGRFDEAKVEHERTLQIDPTSLIFHTELAAYHFVTRDFDKAISAAQTVVEMEPSYAFGHVFLSFAFGQKGMKQEAANAYVKSVETFGEAKEAEELRRALVEKGIDAMWRKRIEQVDDPERRQSFSAQWRALIHIRLGEKEKALAWLEESYRRRDRWMINIKYSPEMDSLRSEPRFLALVKQVGI
jgi:TolB-like protein/Tfp pilus assembly protein PilF